MVIWGFFESLLRVFHINTMIERSKGVVDIVNLSFVYTVSLVTCIDKASQHVLYMMFHIRKYICIIEVYHLIITSPFELV